MDQISGTTVPETATQAPMESQPAGGAPASVTPADVTAAGATPADVTAAGATPTAGAGAAEPLGFRSRGGARRRARFLRKARELGYRDLGGLVFNLHRFGQRNDALVLAKLTTLSHIDAELRALEATLRERRAVTVLREAGITACPRCAAIHSSEDSFCPNCGMSMRRHADLPADLGSAGTHIPAATPTPMAASAAEQASMPVSTPLPSPPLVESTAPPVPAAPGASPQAPTSSQAPAPASDMLGATSAPSPPPAGRSPAPPSSSSGTSVRSQPPHTHARASVQDGPTEILGPPTPDR